MRFGLVGTGYWARATHAAAIASTAGASLAAVWGRNPQATASLAAEHGAAAFTGEEAIDAFLDGVDAVAFSVPPYVQAVTIFAHPDPAGQRNAEELACRLVARAVEVLIEGLR